MAKGFGSLACERLAQAHASRGCSGSASLRPFFVGLNPYLPWPMLNLIFVFVVRVVLTRVRGQLLESLPLQIEANSK
jgi:hypothetical protein